MPMVFDQLLHLDDLHCQPSLKADQVAAEGWAIQQDAPVLEPAVAALFRDLPYPRYKPAL